MKSMLLILFLLAFKVVRYDMAETVLMFSILWFKAGVLIVRQFKVSNVGIVV
jgi:phosphate starvation-inducible membrane PsiE